MKKRKNTLLMVAFAVLLGFSSGNSASAVQVGVQFQVNDSVDAFELITGASRRLTFGYNVPELMVENPDIIQATPVAQNEVLISGLKPGISTITVSDPDKNLQTITVHVTVDVRKLERAFSKHFPDSNIKVDALQTGVILTGYVARADQIENVLKVAADYFPTTVINEMSVNGTQNIAIKVKVYEVSRSKLRRLGIDWSAIGPDAGVVSSVSDLIQSFSLSDGNVQAQGQNFTFGVVGDNFAFNAFIEALETRNIAKLLDQPTLVAQNGRPAEFLSGGEVPIQVQGGLGSNAVEFRPFGTKLDLVPIVHGQGQLTLEVRAEVSEIANDLSGDTGVPGFRVRRVNTGVRMKAGHTLALAGDYREDSQGSQRGTPGLMDSPIFGPLFRKNTDETNETELVFLITPRFISEVEPHQVPNYGVGQLTQRPSDSEFYRDAYMEVPKCKDDCPINDGFDNPNYRQLQQLLPQDASMPMGGHYAPQNGGQRFPAPPTTGSKSGFPSFSKFKNSLKRPARQANSDAGGFNWPSQRR